MEVLVMPERTNKGVAWSWLKAALLEAVGKKRSNEILDRYYTLLHEEYKDRRKVNAVAELEAMRPLLELARREGRLADARRLERMIAHRERLIG